MINAIRLWSSAEDNDVDEDEDEDEYNDYDEWG